MAAAVAIASARFCVSVNSVFIAPLAYRSQVAPPES
jgi:hypothetical protein